jgi:hypothetical protein
MEYVFALLRGGVIVKIFFTIEKALIVACTEGLSVVRYHRFPNGDVKSMLIYEPGAQNA